MPKAVATITNPVANPDGSFAVVVYFVVNGFTSSFVQDIDPVVSATLLNAQVRDGIRTEALAQFSVQLGPTDVILTGGFV